MSKAGRRVRRTLLVALAVMLWLPWLAPPARADEPMFISALDFSGSTLQSDPEGYSISAVAMRGEALGAARHVVMHFSGESDIKVAGPFDLSRPDEVTKFRSYFKQLYQEQRAGATPLAGMVQRALDLFQAENAAPGSELTVFSDGEPDPNPDEQYAAIDALLPEFQSRQWRISVITLGNSSDPWVARMAALATDTNGQHDHVQTKEELHQVFLQQWAVLRGLPTPESWSASLPGNMVHERTMQLDNSVRQATVLVTRPSPAVTLRIIPPGKSEPISPQDPRVKSWVDYDPHFILVSLASQSPLGSGTWRLEIKGPVGDKISGAEVYTSRFAVDLVRPATNALIPTRTPYRFEVQLTDNGQPVAQAGAKVVLQIFDSFDKPVVSQRLLDDGDQSASGDKTPGDGVFSQNITLDRKGSYQYQVDVSLPDGTVKSRKGSLTADSFPTLEGLPHAVHQFKQGETLEIPVAQVVAGAGDADPKSFKRITAAITAPGDRPVGAPANLDPEQAIRNGKLYVPITPKPGDGVVQADRFGGIEKIIYTVDVTWAGEYRGHEFGQDSGLKIPIELQLTLKETLGHRIGRYSAAVWAFVRKYAAPIVVVLLTLLAALAVYLARRRIRTAPRLRGFLTEEAGRRQAGAVFDLSDAMSAVRWWHKLIRVRANLAVLHPPLSDVQIAVGSRQRMQVSADPNLGAKLNGTPLDARWKPLTTGARLTIGESSFRYSETIYEGAGRSRQRSAPDSARQRRFGDARGERGRSGASGGSHHRHSAGGGSSRGGRGRTAGGRRRRRSDW